jgi:predicted nucleic acid-binding protein
VRLLLRLPLADAAEEHVFDARQRSAAPDLLNAEVLHALRRFERRGELDAERSAEAIQDLSLLPIARYPTIALLDRAWALRNNFTAYDALYVALAEALDTPLVTSDERLASAARTHAGVSIVLIA